MPRGSGQSGTLPSAARGGEAGGGLGQSVPARPVEGREICTIRGLYANGTHWCGRVRQHTEGEVQVEVTRIRISNPFAIRFEADECTGGENLGRFERGKRLWVPVRCLHW